MEDVSSKRKLWLALVIPFVALLLFPAFTTFVDPWFQFPEWMQPNQRGKRSSCSVETQHIYLAISLYAKDNQNDLPFVNNGVVSVGWADAIQPYYRGAFACPSEVTTNLGILPSKREYSDYWLNRNLSGRSLSLPTSPTQALLLGDGNDGRDNSDASYSLNAFPQRWLSDRSSPMYRHLGGANYVFADGHIQWLRPNEVKNFGGRNNAFDLKSLRNLLISK